MRVTLCACMRPWFRCRVPRVQDSTSQSTPPSFPPSLPRKTQRWRKKPFSSRRRGPNKAFPPPLLSEYTPALCFSPGFSCDPERDRQPLEGWSVVNVINNQPINQLVNPSLPKTTPKVPTVAHLQGKSTSAYHRQRRHRVAFDGKACVVSAVRKGTFPV